MLGVMSPRRTLHHTRRRLLDLATRTQRRLGGESTTMVLLGALVGTVAGLAAVSFVLLVRAIESLVWDWSPALDDVAPIDALQAADSALPAYYPLLVVPLGMLLVVALVRRFSPMAGGHGVPEVMEAVAQRSGRMRARVGWVKLLASSLNVGFGGSVGKEGPIVQVGAAFGSAVGRLLGVSGPPLRTLLGCGAAAGIAAVFNAPIGGVMFALEIIMGSYSLSAFAPVLIASVAGAVTSRRLLGAQAAFAIPESLREGLLLVSPWEIAAYALLGLLTAFCSLGFAASMYAIEDRLRAWRIPALPKAAVAGLLVGGLGMFWPQVLGEGHHSMSEVLVADAMDLPWLLLVTLAVVKTVATALTLGGGGSGGVFAPSLFVGAMLGGAFGQGLEALVPGSVGGVGAYAIAGMAGMLAGTAHAPMTAILLLFEMSDNYLLILPLMTTAVIASVVSSRRQPESIYTLALSRRGVLLSDPRDTALLRALRVRDAMLPPTDVISENARFEQIVRRLLQSDGHDFPVVDARGVLVGAISLADVREFLREEHLDQLLLAGECAHAVRTLHPADTLLQAMDALEGGETYEVPVVHDGRLVGSLSRARLLSTYRGALRQHSTRAGTRPDR